MENYDKKDSTTNCNVTILNVQPWHLYDVTVSQKSVMAAFLSSVSATSVMTIKTLSKKDVGTF